MWRKAEKWLYFTHNSDWDIHNTWWLLGLLNCHNKEVTWMLESTVGVSTVCTDVLLLQEEV